MITQTNLFGEVVKAPTPDTQGIKYAGSKLKLLPSILATIQDLKPRTVFDGFSGSTRVSQALAQAGYTVFANDISEYSYVFGTCYLKNTQPHSYYKSLVEHLNNLDGIDGWFSQHYGGMVAASGNRIESPDGLKKPWQMHNTRKLDAIREEIDRLNLPFVEKAVLITSLVLALDEVDSTLGHFSSYLNNWSPRSYKNIVLKVPKIWQNEAPHVVTKGEIFEILPSIKADLAYLDPPYGSNNEKMPPSRVRYGAYYHVWTTICLNDKPELFGKALRRTDTSDRFRSSLFEEFRKNEHDRFIALQALDDLISAVNAQYILLSYSSGGRATAEELKEVISKHGKLLGVESINYKKNVMATMRWTNTWTREIEEPNKEFLFLVEK